MTAAPTIEQLLGPGGQYEIGTEDVLGVPLQVYKQRFRSMRDVIAIGASRSASTTPRRARSPSRSTGSASGPVTAWRCSRRTPSSGS